jgi:8-oxo-dGTP pyrophosphatase MutT (NUDIX family)
MGGRENKDLETDARKELFEEIGGVTSNLEYIHYFYANNGVSDIRCDVFLARDVNVGVNQPEESELIEIEVFPQNEVFRMAYAGEITDGMSALSLFLCEKFL